jgi:hypothetical protein
MARRPNRPATVVLPARLTYAMRASWYGADPKTNDHIMDAVWAALKRHAVRGHDGNDDLPPRH